MLYDPERHEIVKADPWDAGFVAGHIDEIVQETEAARLKDGTWPVHPRDSNTAPGEPLHKSMYMGATGVEWALDYLRRARGSASGDPALWGRLLAEYRKNPDTKAVVPSWFLGESAILLLNYLRAKEAKSGDELHAAVLGNAEHPARELLWGAPGTMLAALFAWEATGEDRWKTAYLRGAEALLKAWEMDSKLGADLWMQDLYGRKKKAYGAAHGFAGNAYALLRGRKILGAAAAEEITRRAVATTKKLVERDDGFANWARAAGPGDDAAMVLQWCHGAPGFLLTIGAEVPKGYDRELDTIMDEAGELIWEAGPLGKGACLCHGTDGNGMALLSLYERDGDKVWLERARTFAMAAIEQSIAFNDEYRRRRYALWTGDLGLAVYLQACVDGKALMPMLSVL